MHIPDEVLRGIGVFTPNGKNDAMRVDETRTPFWSIDCFNPHEIDDAIRVTRGRAGSFITDVALADGSQLSDEEAIVQDAMDRVESQYGYRQKLMLPTEVTSQLELKTNETRRALVMRQMFDTYMAPVGDPTFRPAFVYTRRILPVSLGKKFATESTEFSAMEAVANEHGVTTKIDSLSPSKYQLQEVGYKTVQFFMQLTNENFAKWALGNEVPVLNRAFQQNADQTVVTRAFYTTDAIGHTGVEAGREFMYSRITSQLRRASDLLNGINAGAFFAKEAFPYGQSDLESFALKASPIR